MISVADWHFGCCSFLDESVINKGVCPISQEQNTMSNEDDNSGRKADVQLSNHRRDECSVQMRSSISTTSSKSTVATATAMLRRALSLVLSVITFTASFTVTLCILGLVVFSLYQMSRN
jgi:hypothetical protein